MSTRSIYLVTGGAGFIGSHLVEALVRRGDRVRVIDNLVTGYLENLSPFLSDIEFIEADLTAYEAAVQVMKGVSVVLHQAALPSVPRSIADPIASNHANVTGTLNALTAAKDAGVRRFVYASSSSPYGDSPVLPKVETMTPMPRSPYAVAKLAGEYYCRVFAGVYGMETIALRYFNVFGPRQDPDSPYSAVIPRFVRAYLEGTAPTIDGDGEQTRGYTYIENVVQANLLASSAEGVAGEVFNVSGEERLSLNQIDAAIRRLTGVGETLTPAYGPERAGDIKHSHADISKAKRLLGYSVNVATEEGLRRTVEWYRQRA